MSTCLCTGACRELGYCPGNGQTAAGLPSRSKPDDPMTTETARMFFDRATKAEAEVARLRAYVETLPYPSDLEVLRTDLDLAAEALRDIAKVDPVDAALDPQRPVRIAKAWLRKHDTNG